MNIFMKLSMTSCKKLVIAFGILSFILMYGCEQVKSTMIRDMTGDELVIGSDSEVDWTLVTFWADWCRYCREEIPVLNAIHEGNNSMQVWGIDYDEATGVEGEFEQKQQLMAMVFPTLDKNSAESLNLDKPTIIPTIYILNRDRHVVLKLVGPKTQGQIEEEVASLN